jgi:hypothetical protein
MVNIYFAEKNGKKYAYRSTSRYDPDKKYPVTIGEYLGRVDEKTGEIMPKRRKTGAAAEDEVKPAGVGKPLAAAGPEETTEPKDDPSPPSDNKEKKTQNTQAPVVAQISAGTPVLLLSVGGVPDGNRIKELLDITERFASPKVREFIKKIGNHIRLCRDAVKKNV